MDYLLVTFIIIYVALMILVGYIAWKHISNTEDYLVAGRQSNSYNGIKLWCYYLLSLQQLLVLEELQERIILEYYD